MDRANRARASPGDRIMGLMDRAREARARARARVGLEETGMTDSPCQ